MQYIELLYTIIMLPACWAVVGISACRLNNLDRLKSKRQWLLCYLALASLAALAGVELLRLNHPEFGDFAPRIVAARLGEALLVWWALWRLWATRKKWQGSGADDLHRDVAPPESNRAPLGDK